MTQISCAVATGAICIAANCAAVMLKAWFSGCATPLSSRAPCGSLPTSSTRQPAALSPSGSLKLTCAERATGPAPLVSCSAVTVTTGGVCVGAGEGDGDGEPAGGETVKWTGVLEKAPSEATTQISCAVV